MAVFGKALGNGFPISAVIGRKKVMDAAQETFISSTFWTERIGFVAALATIAKMRRCHVPEKLVEYGRMIQEGWESAAARHGITVQVSGIPSLAHLQFMHQDGLALQTYFTQYMLAKGFLASGSAYSSYAYTPEIIGLYLSAVDQAFEQMGNCLKKGEDIKTYLQGPVKHSGFKRLT